MHAAYIDFFHFEKPKSYASLLRTIVFPVQSQTVSFSEVNGKILPYLVLSSVTQICEANNTGLIKHVVPGNGRGGVSSGKRGVWASCA